MKDPLCHWCALDIELEMDEGVRNRCNYVERLFIRTLNILKVLMHELRVMISKVELRVRTKIGRKNGARADLVFQNGGTN